MQRPAHFELEEFLTSSMARQKSIENMPSWEIVEHLNELALWLDELREAWGGAINVTSGYRNEKLNDIVGGVKSSAHKLGYAADIQPANGQFGKFVAFIKDWVKDKAYDQIIEEKKGKTRWVHIGLKNGKGEQRRQLFNVTVK